MQIQDDSITKKTMHEAIIKKEFELFPDRFFLEIL